MEYSLDKKISVIYLRNRLLTGTSEKLKNYYSYGENFYEFLDAVHIELNTEPEYFLLHDKIIRNVEELIQNLRFQYKDADTINKINEIIVQINRLKATPEKEKKNYIKKYWVSQEKIRQMPFINKDDLLCSIVNDGLLMIRLRDGNLGSIDALSLMSSTNYLLETVPEFYQEDSTRFDITIERLQLLTNQKYWLTRYAAKKSLKELEKVYIKKEE